MKKSSLGRRSSLFGQGRLSNIDRSSLRNTAEGKKSFIPKPHYGSKNDRASSCDREGVGSSVKKEQPMQSNLRRSRSFHGDLNRFSTPCRTPTQFNRRNTAGGSYRKASEGGRPSSIGAPKSARKESRPISEKSFQLDAQQKIQNFFLAHAPNLLEKSSIKPMTNSMFADMINFLIQRYDKRMIVNRANLVDEVPNICKQYNYKGKAEKSWLMTVNAPHSWPYVVSFLLWLVELFLCCEAFDVQEALYPEKVEGDADVEADDIDFKLLVPHLLKGFKLTDDTEERNQFLAEQKKAMSLDDYELEMIQKEYSDLQMEFETIKDTSEEEKLSTLTSAAESLRNDIRNTQAFIYDTENYVTNMNDKRQEKVSHFDEYDNVIQTLKEKQKQLQMIVSSQEMTQEYKQKIEDQIATLRRENRQYDEEISDYRDVAYKEDLELVKNRNELNKLIQIFNKEITVNLVKLPSLKNVQIDDPKIIVMEGPHYDKKSEQIDFNLKEQKIDLKNRKRDSEMEEQNSCLHFQKIEDELILLREEKDRLSSELNHLENEITDNRTAIAHAKDRKNTALYEINQKIETEKAINDAETELDSMNHLYLCEQEKVDNYVVRCREHLEEKKKTNCQFRLTLEEITRRRLAETKERIRLLEEQE